MKIFLIFSLTLILHNSAFAFDPAKLDQGISEWLHNIFHDQCDDIEYSFVYAQEMGDAMKRGLYTWNLLEKYRPDDLDVSIRFNICGWNDGYYLTVRKDEHNNYIVLGYVAYSHPPY